MLFISPINLNFSVYLNNYPVESCQCEKHLGVKLDKKLNFNEYISRNNKFCTKGIGTMKYLPSISPGVYC